MYGCRYDQLIHFVCMYVIYGFIDKSVMNLYFCESWDLDSKIRSLDAKTQHMAVPGSWQECVYKIQNFVTEDTH